MRLFPLVFTTKLAGFPGQAFSILSGSSLTWGTVYTAERNRGREREIKKIERDRERER